MTWPGLLELWVLATAAAVVVFSVPTLGLLACAAASISAAARMSVEGDVEKTKWK